MMHTIALGNQRLRRMRSAQASAFIAFAYDKCKYITQFYNDLLELR